MSSSGFCGAYASYYGHDFTRGVGDKVASMFLIGKEELTVPPVGGGETLQASSIVGPSTGAERGGLACQVFGVLPFYISSFEEERSAIAVVAMSSKGCLCNLQTNDHFAQLFFDNESFQDNMFNRHLLPIMVFSGIIVPADREEFLREACTLCFSDEQKEIKKTLMVSSMPIPQESLKNMIAFNQLSCFAFVCG